MIQSDNSIKIIRKEALEGVVNGMFYTCNSGIQDAMNKYGFKCLFVSVKFSDSDKNAIYAKAFKKDKELKETEIELFKEVKEATGIHLVRDKRVLKAI